MGTPWQQPRHRRNNCSSPPAPSSAAAARLLGSQRLHPRAGARSAAPLRHHHPAAAAAVPPPAAAAARFAAGWACPLGETKPWRGRLPTYPGGAPALWCGKEGSEGAAWQGRKRPDPLVCCQRHC